MSNYYVRKNLTRKSSILSRGTVLKFRRILQSNIKA